MGAQLVFGRASRFLLTFGQVVDWCNLAGGRGRSDRRERAEPRFWEIDPRGVHLRRPTCPPPVSGCDSAALYLLTLGAEIPGDSGRHLCQELLVHVPQPMTAFGVGAKTALMLEARNCWPRCPVLGQPTVNQPVPSVLPASAAAGSDNR